MIKGYIFDLDGTLLDTLANLAGTFNRTLARFGYPEHPEDAYRYFIGDGLREALDPQDHAYGRSILDIMIQAEPDLVREAGSLPGLEASLLDPLKERELQVLRLIAAGLSNREIAGELFLTEGTVKSYTHQIYSKLGVHRRTEAVEKARELGLLP